ncbi:MAG: hypothetical protein E7632_11545 [Ruminococcaceae bacterium]|nr:hypothetical protein [Oscillospiraceae bacterium]
MAFSDKKQLHLAVAFGIYCLAVVFMLFVAAPLHGMRTVSDIAADANLREFSNFIPFKTVGEYLLSHDVGTLLFHTVGNVAMAIPCGILLPALFRRTRQMSSVIVATAAATFILEFCQLMLRIGSFDIDTIILRAVGAAVGFLLYRRLIGHKA